MRDLRLSHSGNVEVLCTLGCSLRSWVNNFRILDVSKVSCIFLSVVKGSKKRRFDTKYEDTKVL